MTGIIILAAGESCRLGEPKQNLIFQGKTLLQRAIETALSSACETVLVVLGANAELIKPTLQPYKVEVIVNANWTEGMASSIRAGVEALQRNELIENVLILLCDQPFVSLSLINNLLQKQQDTLKPIVACNYKDTIGVPVIFNRLLFTRLLLLKGHEGAKKMIAGYPDDVATVPFDLGTVDIDTVEDYNRLISQ
ncbi:nucleotidyltransferase family protein [Mucilaginibacter polytrichastri]|uniref:MobA-like NTP transferase domain-containing protein n=1 Tax=Mucilaginibacter polytrichastri TaxID=1302689 RepID=A0A1Q5ZW60_9SPHI|nr:nucleotidyltransferase family protein [Mucilaginibacter polytrichastri]OKS86011.1 hypothetical protein RG47T_1458 [Mucilaginibacter polytrichastri]SFS59721.1 molybdenum cofactor cytidylyltransferase [Mucilaginibacter polytrichastri]